MSSDDKAKKRRELIRRIKEEATPEMLAAADDFTERIMSFKVPPGYKWRHEEYREEDGDDR